MQALGTTWNIDPLYFVEHTHRKGKSSNVWKEVFGTSPANQTRPWSHISHSSPHDVGSNPTMSTRDTHWHVDGLALYGHGIASERDISMYNAFGTRMPAIGGDLGRHEKTRISCYRKDKGGCECGNCIYLMFVADFLHQALYLLTRKECRTKVAALSPAQGNFYFSQWQTTAVDYPFLNCSPKITSLCAASSTNF